MKTKKHTTLWCSIIVTLIIFGLCGCMDQPVDDTVSNATSHDKVICIQCEAEIDADDIYCRYCGHTVVGEIAETDPVEILFDYSDFGFVQNYGMTEWVRIEDGDLSDRDNASVTASISGEPCFVISFANNYIEVRSFNSNYSHEYEGHFLGNRTDGTLDDTYPYQTVSNYVLELQTTNNKNVEILDVQIISGIPIVQIKAGSPAYSINGYYIPTDFIDWSREPITEGNLSPITYFLKPEFLL